MRTCVRSQIGPVDLFLFYRRIPNPSVNYFLDLFLRLPNCVDGSRWSWFRRYCAAVRAATGLMRRTPLPDSFISEVAVKIAMTSYYW